MNKKEQNTKIMLGLAKPPKSTWAKHQNSAWGKHRVVCHMQTKNKKKKARNDIVISGGTVTADA